jgi:hypothetical protein
LKGRSPENPGRLLIIHCDATTLATAKKETIPNNILLIMLLQLLKLLGKWLGFFKEMLAALIKPG